MTEPVLDVRRRVRIVVVSAALLSAWLGLGATLGACSDDDDAPADPDGSVEPGGPYDGVDLTGEIRGDGLDAPVHVVRDQYGILHINATTVGDLGYAQGYMMAHDRLPQMDILRRFGAGTLSELFGNLDTGVIETDLEMRMHRMTPLAQQAWDELSTATDDAGIELRALLERFAAGVNAYNAELAAGNYELDEAIAQTFDPARFRAWTPVDSLVLGRFQAFSLSWTAPTEIDLTDLYQQAVTLFDQAVGPISDPYARRIGAAQDLLRLAPIGQTATIDGFPNVETDTGSRANGTFDAPGGGGGAGAGPAPASSPQRPQVSRELMARARDFFRKKMAMGPHAFMVPRAGSNNWVVSPEHGGGKALIAGDQHLSLPNPTILYPNHLVIPGKLDVYGVTFPGIPGIILGHNGKVAWQSTVVLHDVNDVYDERVLPCATSAADCVLFNGAEVPIETWDEEIKVGVLGTITETRTATYEMVPHHGPIIPTVVNGQLVPRTGGEALSVRYTGHSLTNEIRAAYGLLYARNVDEAFTALGNFEFGGQNWVIADNSGNIGWTTNAKVPLRPAAAYAWHPGENKGGLAPFLILPGDGSAEWEGYMEPRYIPHSINPAKGYLVTANSDPVGASFDGVPFNGPVVDGRPLYVGANYTAGVRSERIAALLDERIANGETLDVEAMAAIQRDSSSTMGAKLRDGLVHTLSGLVDQTGYDALYADYVLDTLGNADRAKLTAARDRLAAWTLATPPAVQGTPSAGEIGDSVATSLFNVWMHFALEDIVGDEYAALGWNVHSLDENLTARVIYALFAARDTLTSGSSTFSDQPWLCDSMTTKQVESCDLIALMSMQKAIAWLESKDGFGTTDDSAWRWGQMHRLVLKPLFPEATLNVPAANDPDPDLRDGFPRAGDNFVINRSDSGWDDLDFTQTEDGPAQRFVAEIATGGTVQVHQSLPGGTVFDRSSAHYRDLLDNYYLPNQLFVVPYSTDEIVAAGEERWLVH